VSSGLYLRFELGFDDGADDVEIGARRYTSGRRRRWDGFESGLVAFRLFFGTACLTAAESQSCSKRLAPGPMAMARIGESGAAGEHGLVELPEFLWQSAGRIRGAAADAVPHSRLLSLDEFKRGL